MGISDYHFEKQNQYNTGIGWAIFPTAWYFWHCSDCGWIRREFVKECSRKDFPYDAVGCPWCGRRIHERFWEITPRGSISAIEERPGVYCEG